MIPDTSQAKEAILWAAVDYGGNWTDDSMAPIEQIAYDLANGEATADQLERFLTHLTTRRVLGEIPEDVFRQAMSAAAELYAWGRKQGKS